MANDVQVVKFKGELRWASVPPNPPRKPYEIDPNQPNNCSYSIEVECSKEKFKELQKAGIPRLTTLREDERGKTFLRLKASKIKGDLEFKDPFVIDKNGVAVTSKIANGSKGIVIANLAPIKGRSGKALRLVGVQVLDLIPYENTEGNKYKDYLELDPASGYMDNSQDLNPEEDLF